MLSFLEGATRQLQRDDRVDQSLLCAVVKVANHPAALLVGRRRDPRPRDAATSVCASVFAIAVATSSVKEVRRTSASGGKGLLPAVGGGHQAPEAAINNDRRRDP